MFPKLAAQVRYLYQIGIRGGLGKVTEARIESARLKSFESARLLTCPHPHCDNCDKTNAMLSMAFSEPS